MKMGPKSEDELKTVRGMKKFCALTGFAAEQVKAVLKTPAGAKAVVQDRYDPLAFCRAYNEWKKNRAGEPQTESEARTKKLNAETRAIEREELLENKVLQLESEVDANFRHGNLVPLRDGLQGLQKKYHRFKAIQPDIAVKILENDLPELVEKLKSATEIKSQEEL